MKLKKYYKFAKFSAISPIAQFTTYQCTFSTGWGQITGWEVILGNYWMLLELKI
jgi:hypothetical protein